jgi:hypothetical protein
MGPRIRGKLMLGLYLVAPWATESVESQCLVSTWWPHGPPNPWKVNAWLVLGGPMGHGPPNPWKVSAWLVLGGPMAPRIRGTLVLG